MYETAWKKTWHFLLFWDKVLVGPVAYETGKWARSFAFINFIKESTESETNVWIIGGKEKKDILIPFCLYLKTNNKSQWGLLCIVSTYITHPSFYILSQNVTIY